jgi:hypothetical protein
VTANDQFGALLCGWGREKRCESTLGLRACFFSGYGGGGLGRTEVRPRQGECGARSEAERSTDDEHAHSPFLSDGSVGTGDNTGRMEEICNVHDLGYFTL